jgi:hypothetical protein
MIYIKKHIKGTSDAQFAVDLFLLNDFLDSNQLIKLVANNLRRCTTAEFGPNPSRNPGG